MEGIVNQDNGLTREQIETRVRALGEWFHNLDLRGVQTAPNHFLGDYPRARWSRLAHAIPQDLRGKTVLDIGCNGGFYAIEMKRRGAARVLGIDTDAGYLAQARFAADVSGVDIELRKMSVYEVAKLRETFDIVIFLGVLCHLRHPMLALELLREHAVGDLLLFQSMLRSSLLVESIEEDYPVDEEIVIDPTSSETSWWVPDRAGAEAMLRSAGFEVVSHPEAEVFLCRRAERPGDEALSVVSRAHASR
jgi:tRNA (mo5U34)-methyltransferase